MSSDRWIYARFRSHNDACRRKNSFQLCYFFLFSIFIFFFFALSTRIFSPATLLPSSPLCFITLFSFSSSPFFLFFAERERREKPANSLCSAGSFVAETESRPDRRANEASIVPFCFLIQRDASGKQRDELTTLKNDEFSGHCTEMLAHARAGCSLAENLDFVSFAIRDGYFYGYY